MICDKLQLPEVAKVEALQLFDEVANKRTACLAKGILYAHIFDSSSVSSKVFISDTIAVCAYAGAEINTYASFILASIHCASLLVSVPPSRTHTLKCTSRASTRAHTHIHTTHTHRHTHNHTRTHTPSLYLSLKRTHTHAHTHTHLRTQHHSLTHTRTHAYTHKQQRRARVGKVTTNPPLFSLSLSLVYARGSLSLVRGL